jgi:hypothetical protein
MTTDDQTGAYGIEQDPSGRMSCPQCGRRWSEDITPSGRCPWEHLHDDGEPDLPYAGTEGWSGSEASRARAVEQAQGEAGDRQERILHALDAHEENGATWAELGRDLGLHHGQVTGSLSSMHKAGTISRLQERRGRSSIYVLPQYVGDRPTSRQGRSSRDLRGPLTSRILGSLQDPNGCASDANVDARDYHPDLDPHVEIHGRLDIQHLVSEILEVIGGAR